ncbi:MAG: hypothetical protein L3J36_16400 [Rhodobacteraceae bacterium]|nr:hypothetical protein [Paracoccaceae bacterium]
MMHRQAEIFVRRMLAMALMLGLVLSLNGWSSSHSPEALVVAAQNQVGGHPHKAAVDLSYAFHGHAHEVADHEHHTAFLPPRTAQGHPLPDRSRRMLALARLKPGHAFALERPPRG